MLVFTHWTYTNKELKKRKIKGTDELNLTKNINIEFNRLLK